MKYLSLIFFMSLLPQYAGKSLRGDGSHPRTFEDIKNEIAGYSDTAKAIIDLAVHGKAQNRSYERLAVFADTVGPRLSGSKNLDAAIQYMFSALQKDGLENVHLEPVKVPHWERGEEFAVMLEPRNHSIAILGLGSSVATPPEGITAEVMVVASFDELHRRAQEAKGKIVVYNQPFVTYGETVRYRSQGAVEAAKVGAVATLIRSIASFSIDSPHTGWQNYQSGVPQIPTACISVEDAEMMSRMALRGTKIVVYLKMGARTYPDSPSFNTVAEIVGNKYPEQIVLVSGHLDSWDVGQGAMDDGGGAFISWEALSLIKDLGLRPKRTLRMVLWTGEEQGGVGAEQYYQLHKENISNFDIVMESDEGTFKPSGLAFTGNAKARDIIKEIMALLLPINVTDVFDNADGTDINYWMRDGVPGASLRDDLSKYFWFHHSQGDTMTVQDPNQMNLCAAVWTVVSYVIADMEEMLPRTQKNQDLEDRKSIMGFPALQTGAAPVFLWSPPHGNLCLSFSFWWKTHNRDMQRIACGSFSLKRHEVSETAITAVICDLHYLPADVQMKCKSRYWFMVLKPFTELPLSLCWVSPAGI
uniref:Carboxypeptidase Q n=2 Tax=Anatinae TaxID=2068716 RepID=A0A8C3B5W3_CAIMO